MASLKDVEDALVATIAGGLYPGGSGSACAAGTDCRVFRGWPVAASLEADLVRGIANISVVPLPGGRATTRWLEDVPVQQAAQPTLLVDVQGATVGFSGDAAPGQLAGILVGGQGYVHRTIGNDTPASVAQSLAWLIAPTFALAQRAGTLLFVHETDVVARVVADTPGMRELRRQAEQLRVSIWCATPQQRDTVSALVDGLVSASDFLALPGGDCARIRYEGGTSFDERETAGLYRHDIVFGAEFAVTQAISSPAMLFGTLQFETLRITV